VESILGLEGSAERRDLREVEPGDSPEPEVVCFSPASARLFCTSNWNVKRITHRNVTVI
jgi:hypothetical protein